MNYYNEHDPKAAAWLRALIDAGHIAPGIVDTRSISGVQPDELTDYAQCHFFAGIGGWSLALRYAGWPDNRPVWTGSCPCQPFSVAGKGRGTADERHLWPVFAELIRACKPPVVFGEQVASKAGRDWLAGVFADLEGMAYQRAGADLCAAGVGAPHIRQRLFWVADSKSAGTWKNQRGIWGMLGGCCQTGGMADSESIGGRQGEPDTRRSFEGGYQEQRSLSICGSAGSLGGMDNAASSRCNGQEQKPETEARHETRVRLLGPPGWSTAAPILCRDGKTRRIPSEPALFPLADGLPGRVGLLRGAGNAIVPLLAAEFVSAWMDCSNA